MVDLGGGRHVCIPTNETLQSRDEKLLFHSLLSSLELSAAHVYEPHIRALIGITSHFCEVVVSVIQSTVSRDQSREVRHINIPEAILAVSAENDLGRSKV